MLFIMAPGRSVVSWTFALMLGIGLALATGAYAQNDSCSEPFTKVPFMKTPVSHEDLQKLITAVQGFLPGGSSSEKPDMATVKQDLIDYIKKYSIQPVAGVIAMFALVILSLLIFLLWRFTRCLCVMCCQQESYADGAKVLTSRGIRGRKAAMFVLGLVGMAVAAWGMSSVDKQFPVQVSTEVDTVQQFPLKLITKIEQLAGELGNITVPLDNFQGIVAGLNITGMQADLAHVEDFFNNAPTPALLKAILQNLTNALSTDLVNALGDLARQIDASNASVPLGQLKANIGILTNFSSQAAAMATVIGAYNTSIATLAAQGSAPSTSSAPYTDMVAKQAPMPGDVTAWLAAISKCQTAAQNIQQSQNSNTNNPFTVIKGSLSNVNSTVNDIQDNKLASLVSAISRFNGMWYHNASSAVQSLLDRAVYINQTVIVLPSSVASQITMLNTSLADVMALYTGPDSLLYLPANITAFASGLSMPEMGGLQGNLTDAEDKLNNADLQPVIDQFGNLTTAMTAFQTAVNDLGAALVTYSNSGATDSDWSALQPHLMTTGTVASTVGTGLGSYDAGSFMTGPGADLGSFVSGGALSGQTAAISSVQATVAEFDMSSFTSALNQADTAYAAFGSDPTQLTSPIKDMLSKVNDMATTQLSDARSKVSNFTDQIDTAVGSLRKMTITKLDDIQARFLVSNSTDGQVALAEKYWAYAYMGLLIPYGIVMLVMLLVFLFTYLNWVAGICFFSFLLNILLIIFAILPIIYTIVMVVMRDTCANVEYVGLQAAKLKLGEDSIGYKLAHYYLADGTLPNGTAIDLGGLMGSVNSDYDINQLKGRVNQTIADAIDNIKSGYTVQHSVQAVLDDVVTRVAGLLTSVDGLIDLLDYPSVSAVITQVKGWICCDLTEQLYVQWVSCLVLLAMTWLAMICALTVLRKLDGLSDSCCACSCYKASDYAAEGAAGGRKPSVTGTTSADAEAVAVITIGGLAPSKKYEVPESQTPLPAPLHVMTSPASAPVMQSPRMYPSIGPAAPNGGAGYIPPSDLQQQRMSLIGQMYPSLPVQYNYSMPPPPQQQPMPQGWGRNSPSPSGVGHFPRI